VARGGKFALVNVDKIPTEAIDLVLQIDKELEKYGKRFYGVDLGFTPQGPKIIEMNSRLGLLPNSDGEAFVRLKKKLAQTLVSMV
jgi:glutathione synthase/RimK-type ligase-like ATP-grasp enzyme